MPRSTIRPRKEPLEEVQIEGQTKPKPKKKFKEKMGEQREKENDETSLNNKSKKRPVVKRRRRSGILLSQNPKRRKGNVDTANNPRSKDTVPIHQPGSSTIPIQSIKDGSGNSSSSKVVEKMAAVHDTNVQVATLVENALKNNGCKITRTEISKLLGVCRNYPTEYMKTEHYRTSLWKVDRIGKMLAGYGITTFNELEKFIESKDPRLKKEIVSVVLCSQEEDLPKDVPKGVTGITPGLQAQINDIKDKLDVILDLILKLKQAS